MSRKDGVTLSACRDCEVKHVNCHSRSVRLALMEFLLLWWDDLDDFTHACRHLVTCACSELVELTAPLAASLSAMAAWLMLRLQG
jgi:hypothetical protein